MRLNQGTIAGEASMLHEGIGKRALIRTGKDR
jgi:hypothetical protein